MSGTTLAQIKETISDLTPIVIGSDDTKISAPGNLADARPGELVFSKAVGAKLREQINISQAAAVVCADNPFPEGESLPVDLIIVENPRLAFIRVVSELFVPKPPMGIHSTAIVDPNTEIHETAYIGPYSVIGANCVIGANSVLHGHCFLYGNVRIGKEVEIGAHTCIGGEGFGYERDSDGVLIKFPHLGGVCIEDEAHIRSHCIIDRGTLGETRIGRRARIDHGVHVGHNVQIGTDTGVAGDTVFSGGITVGEKVWIAPGVAINNGLDIADDATIGLGAVVVKNVAVGEVVLGNPARPLGEMRAILDHQRSLIK